MFDLSLEQLNTFQDVYYDEQPDQPASALEQLYESTGIKIGCHQDLLKFRDAIKQARLNQPPPIGSDDSAGEEKKTVQFVTGGSNDYILTIDIELIFSLIFGEKELGVFIRQLHAIPASATLHVIPMFLGDEIDTLMLFEGTSLVNMIKLLPCRKVFSFNSMMALPDLMLATCCDEIEVGDQAAISLTKAENGEFITKYIIPVYHHLVKSVFSYWENKGVLTREEIDNLYDDESSNGILLLSDEIRRRLTS